jgi:hypothetical protein
MTNHKQFAIILTLLLSTINTSYAALNALSIHSRANCLNNESISWDGFHYWILATESWHYRVGEPVHLVGSGWENTWRSASVHYGEGNRGGYRAVGYHHIRYEGSDTDKLLGVTNVTDCNIYNGWWEAHPPS